MHGLEIINGEASFFAARQPAWHGLGTILPSNVSAEEAIKIAKLDWHPEIIPLVASFDGFTVEVPGRNLVVREDPEAPGLPIVLGVVGNNYTPIPVEEAAAFAEAISEVDGSVWHTAGVINRGKRIFMLLERPESLVLSNGDAIKRYTMVATANDGTMSLVVKPTNVRVVCQNTMNFALRKAGTTYRVRHTVKYASRMEEAIRALRLEEKYVEAFREQAEKLLSRKMLETEIAEFFAKVAGADLEQGSKKLDELMSIYRAPTQDNARGTAWGALNAVVEYVDFARPSGQRDTAKAAALFSPNALKQKALSLLS